MVGEFRFEHKSLPLLSQNKVNTETARVTRQLASDAAQAQEVIDAVRQVARTPEAQRLFESLNAASPPRPPPRFDDGATLDPGSTTATDLPLERCKMDRQIKTVVDAWMEYDAGIRGNPSIKLMNQVHGKKWRRDHKESQHYSVRKRLWDAIIERHESTGTPAINIAENMDHERQYDTDGRPKKRPLTIRAYIDNLPRNQARIVS